MSEVLIVGGGVMGCAIALRLAQRGLRPIVLERSVPGAEASSVAAGILAPGVEAHAAGYSHTLGAMSREAFVPLAEELREAHGVDVGFRRCGVLALALDGAEAEALEGRRRMLREAGAEAESLSAKEARGREPELSPELEGALWLPEEGQVEPPILLRALALAAVREGARFRTGAYVREVIVEGDRVRGVRVGGERIEAEQVVIAAGSWTSLVGGLGPSAAAVRPVRGQILECETRPPIFRSIVYGAGGYVVPRPDGRILCGATSEEASFNKEVTLEGLGRLIRQATRVAPALGQAPIRGHRVNFRPATHDDLPLLGPAGPAGLWLAAGHFRNGILLAPITAQILAGLLTGEAPPLPIEPLSPERFLAR